MRIHWPSFFGGVLVGLLPAIAFIVWLLGMTFAGPARAAQHHGLSLRALISDCSIDARVNPVVLTCPAGCTVTISNGVGAEPPRIAVSQACQALR